MKQNLKTTAIILLLMLISIETIGIVFLHFNAITERAELRQNQEAIMNHFGIKK